ncbi:MAG: WS/DGAT domain-containing protein [Stagnimonas sp.]|nr:WS/DGAT domain-containing protein [Stagnimonas sp.]
MSEQQTLEPMSAVDRAWLEMDSPENPMVVNAIIDFDGPLDPAALCAELLARLLRYPRFRQRADDQHQPPVWVEDLDFAAAYHAHVMPPERWQPGADLRAAIEAEVNQPLDRSLPLWRVLLFPRRDGGATVLFRAHHAVADGIALVQMLLACTDSGLRAAARTKPALAAAAKRHGPLAGLIGRLEALNRGAEQLLEFARADLHEPRRIPAQLREAGGMLASLRRVLALPSDNPPALQKPLSGKRVLAWASDIPLAPVRRLAHAEGVKLNDVFLSALAGAFDRCLEAQGEPAEARRQLRVSVPVNLRPPKAEGLGNCFGLVLLDLPLGLSDRRQRLALVAERMAELKRSPTARTVLLALAAAGHLPVALEKRLVAQVAGKSAAVVSNLRGPDRPLHLGGARIRELIFWPPQAGGIGLGLSLFSYHHRLSIGVSADRALIAEPQRLIDAFQDELALLLTGGRTRARPSASGKRRPAPRTKTRLSARSAVPASAPAVAAAAPPAARRRAARTVRAGDHETGG